MDKLKIKSITKKKMLQFCTPELLDCVFSHVGNDNIIVDNKNLSKNTWEITTLLQTEHEELLDNLKVIGQYCSMFSLFIVLLPLFCLSLQQ